jgi:dTDP-4-dehydrorhamnose 3,5-epimerase-like enzyme
MRAQFEPGGKRAAILNSRALEQSWNTSMQAAVIPQADAKVINVYPNPSHTGKINLQVSQNTGINGMHYAIISSGGQIMKSGHLESTQKEIDIRVLQPGVYQIRLTDAGTNLFTKFVVQ